MYILKKNVTQQVFEYLKENIEKGIWPVGSKIPSENELTKILSVSRASVRMAIQQCIALDILESQHGRGTFVRHSDVSSVMGRITTINDKDYNDIYQVLQFRQIIEKESSYMATLNMTENDLLSLNENLLKMKTNVGNPIEFVRQDMIFHKKISQIAGNKILEFVLSDVLNKTKKNQQQINSLFGYKDGLYYHTLLLKAFKEKDAKKAKHIMQQHMQNAIDRLKAD